MKTEIFTFAYPAKNIFLLSILLLSACAPQSINTDNPATGEESLTQLPDPAIETDSKDVQSFINEDWGISFDIPEEWYGPDVHTWETGIRIAIGSDVVYPYGTGREEQTYSQDNAYYITIQFDQNAGRLDGSSYVELIDLANGATYSTPRSLSTRLRDLSIGNYRGIEYTVTLPDGAQTERVFIREITLLDENQNRVTISGSPNNVVVRSTETWREDYRLVDEGHKDIFYQVVDSLELP